MRNPLLNFRPGAKSIQVINEIAPEIYDYFYYKKKVTILPTNKKKNLIKNHHLKKKIPI